MLGSVLGQLAQITDAAVVGRVLGPEGLAAVGSVTSLLFFLNGFGFGAANGLAIPIAKAFGAGDLRETRRQIAAGAYIAVAIALFISVLGVGFALPILRLQGLPEYLVPNAALYLRIITGGALFTIGHAYTSAVFRAVGDTKTPMKFDLAAQFINVALTVLFVVFLNFGIPGAAYTTLISVTVTLLAAVIYFKKRLPELVPSRAEWRSGLSAVKEPAQLAFPMGLQNCAVALGVVVIQGAVNSLGGDAIAAYAAVSRIVALIVSPLSAINLAVVTFVAQNRGAELWQRIRHTINRALIISTATALVSGAILFIFARPLVGVFIADTSSLAANLAVGYLHLSAGLFFISGVKFVMRGAVQGMGNTVIPLVSTVLELVVRISVAVFMVRLLGLPAVALGTPIAWAVGFVVNLAVWVRMVRSWNLLPTPAVSSDFAKAA